MRKNKIGSLFLISVLALAGIGVSYAGFTDSISIYGTVDTATVSLEVVDDFSGTYVYKIWGFPEGGPKQMPPIVFEGATLEYDLENEILIYSGFVKLIPTEEQVIAWATAEGNDGNAELVAYSYAAAGSEYDVEMTYDNLFPCIDFEADFIFHYTGSIPAKIDTASIISGDKWLVDLWNLHASGSPYGAWVEAYACEPNDVVGWDIDYTTKVDVGYQLHDCDYVYVKLTIHLPQENDLQGLTGTFGGNIGVIQWNEYPIDDCGPIIG